MNDYKSVTKVHINQLWYDYELKTTYIVKAFEDGMAHLVPYSGADIKSYWLTQEYVLAYYKFSGFDDSDIIQEVNNGKD